MSSAYILIVHDDSGDILRDIVCTKKRNPWRSLPPQWNHKRIARYTTVISVINRISRVRTSIVSHSIQNLKSVRLPIWKWDVIHL